jgi:hypothetical protein
MITKTMVHQGKISNFEKFHHVNELLPFEKNVGFSENCLTVQYKASLSLCL